VPELKATEHDIPCESPDRIVELVEALNSRKGRWRVWKSRVILAKHVFLDHVGANL